MNSRQLAPLGDHSVNVGRDHLGTDVSVQDPADRPDLVVMIVPFLGDQRGIRRHAVNDSVLGGLANLIEIRAVNEDSHEVFLGLSSRLGDDWSISQCRYAD